MPTPIPRQDYIVEVHQNLTRSYRVSAESEEQARSRVGDGTLIHSEAGPETIVSVEPEL